jgi:adenosine deaminase
MEYRSIKKVELHRHLDGSVRFETIVDLARQKNIDLGIDLNDREKLFNKAKVLMPMSGLDEVLDSFWITQKVMCDEQSIERIAFENVEDAFHDGIELIELRFAPTFIREGKKISYDLIIESVIKGVKRGIKKYPIKVGLIHIVPRALSLKESEDATTEILKFKQGIGKNLIVGFDLADGEDFNLIETFKPVLERARSAGLGVTVHSGENTSSKHVRKTIEYLGAQRIGHGIKVMEDPDVMELALRHNIHFEVCPTSNWLTRCVNTIESHPIKKMLDYGLSVSLNSDDPHIMNIDLTHEYEVAHRFLGMNETDFIKMNMNARSASFTS